MSDPEEESEIPEPPAPDLVPRRLLHGEIIYSAARKEDHNVLNELCYWDRREQFFNHLQSHRRLIQQIVAHHLGLSSSDKCHIVDPELWIYGSFNLCILIFVDDAARGPWEHFMMRFPLPYKIGEDLRPGNADEKIRCEAGTFAWLQENCPTISIPELYGFGLSTGQTVCVADPSLRRRLQLLIVHGSGIPTIHDPHLSVHAPASSEMARLPCSNSLRS